MLDISSDTENYLSLLPTLKSNAYIIGKIVLKLINSISKILEKRYWWGGGVGKFQENMRKPSHIFF